MSDANDVLKFWFEDHGQEQWFSSSAAFDQLLKDKFFDLHARVALGEAHSWRATPEGRVAEIIVLDQFSRQLFRGEAKAFATDGMALILAQELIASGGDKSLNNDQRSFAYMPFMHSESLAIHETAVALFTEYGNENMLKFENSHRDIIKQFGRYPKRNEALGRQSSQAEVDYINSRDGSHF